jgi:nucleoside-diphosphate-sugar epimerase
VAKARGVRRVIYMSSFSVYDYAALRNGEQITESSPLEAHPETRGAYTLGKRRAEDIALQQLRETTPAWTILRPSLIVGDGRDIFAAVGPKMGKNLISLSSPRKKLLLVHVDDVATAIVVCLQNPNTKNQVYTLSDQDEITVRDYVKTCIRRDAHKDVRTVYVPYAVARILAATANLFHRVTPRVPGMNPRRLLSVYRNAAANSSLLCNHTGWQPAGRLLARLNGEVHTNSPVEPVEHDQIPVGQA